MTYECTAKVNYRREGKPARPYKITFTSSHKHAAREQAQSYATSVRINGFYITLDSQAQMHYPAHAVDYVVVAVENKVDND